MARPTGSSTTDGWATSGRWSSMISTASPTRAGSTTCCSPSNSSRLRPTLSPRRATAATRRAGIACRATATTSDLRRHHRFGRADPRRSPRPTVGHRIRRRPRPLPRFSGRAGRRSHLSGDLSAAGRPARRRHRLDGAGVPVPRRGRVRGELLARGLAGGRAGRCGPPHRGPGGAGRMARRVEHGRGAGAVRRRRRREGPRRRDARGAGGLRRLGGRPQRIPGVVPGDRRGARRRVPRRRRGVGPRAA